MANGHNGSESYVAQDAKEYGNYFQNRNFSQTINLQYIGHNLDLFKLSTYLENKFFELARNNYINVTFRRTGLDSDHINLEVSITENQNVAVQVDIEVNKTEIKHHNFKIHCQSIPMNSSPQYKKVFSANSRNLFTEVLEYCEKLIYNNNFGIPAMIGIAEGNSNNGNGTDETRLKKRFSFKRTADN